MLARMGICGIDEAGRGPLAGPVVAAAVILPRRGRPRGLDDSKQLTAEAREELALKIREVGIVAVGVASVEEIDALNILRA
jgi:ribonuclease HII